MRMTILACAALAPAAALAEPPPPNAMPLSQLVATLEADVGADLAYVESVEWDDDGYWEVEYRTADDREVEVDLDPTTGKPR